MNNRIKELRTVLGMTQEEFARRLGVKRNTVGNYETGNRTPSEQVIIAICREYSVNEDWLRNGQGSMFIKQDAISLDDYARTCGLTEIEKSILIKFLLIEPSVREVVISSLCKIFSIQDEKKEDVNDIDAKVEAYRRELLSEKKINEKLSRSNMREENLA